MMMMTPEKQHTTLQGVNKVGCRGNKLELE